MVKHRRSSYSSTAEKVLLQPWFLPQRVAFAIHGLVPPDYWKKWHNFFDDYGCLICGSESQYQADGMCRACFNRTRKRLAQSVKRRLKSVPKRSLALEVFLQEKLAKKLLGRYRRRGQTSSPRPGSYVTHGTNPVYEALSPMPQQQ
jgi:hypothetical protein